MESSAQISCIVSEWRSVEVGAEWLLPSLASAVRLELLVLLVTALGSPK